jgi:hypothetical protein
MAEPLDNTANPSPRHKVLIAASVAALLDGQPRIRAIRALADPREATLARQGRVRMEAARIAARRRIVKARLKPVREAEREQ